MPSENYRTEAGPQEEAGIHGGIGSVRDTPISEGRPPRHVTVPVPNLDEARSRPEAAVIRACSDISQPGWLLLRQQLWPHCTADEHRAEMSAFLAEPGRFGQFVEYDAAGHPVGLVEVAIRTDYVNGADTSPVAFLEGIYVVPPARRSGVARELIAAAQRWALDLGCTELASDAAIENTSSHAAHVALGFIETERVVFFKKVLR